ncbi:hypothetical protein BY458DRAFT_436411, partial [Sporodiniella umbellata]
HIQNIADVNSQLRTVNIIDSLTSMFESLFVFKRQMNHNLKKKTFLLCKKVKI